MDNYVKRNDGVVINTNRDDYRRYNELRERSLREKELEKKISTLESEIVRIKKLLNNMNSRIS